MLRYSSSSSGVSNCRLLAQNIFLCSLAVPESKIFFPPLTHGPSFEISGVISLIYSMGVVGVFGGFRFECDYDYEILPLDVYNYELVVVLSLAPITLMHAVCLIWNDLTTQSAYVLAQCLNAWMRFNLMF